MDIVYVNRVGTLIGHSLFSDERADNNSKLDQSALVGHCSKPKQKGQSLLRVIDDVGSNVSDEAFQGEGASMPGREVEAKAGPIT